jgi:hypothetical protein
MGSSEATPVDRRLLESQLLKDRPDAASSQHDGMSMAERTAFSKMKTFCAGILKTLAPPLLREIESSACLRPEAKPFTPRRVTRAFATQSVITPASKKASAAETALLRALGISPANLAVDNAALEEFRHFFDSPIREQHLRAIAMIFGKTVPPRSELLEADRSPPVCVR